MASSFSDFCVGCAVFSGMDQYGIEMSSQKFEGQVFLKFPLSVSSQSLGLPSTLYGAMTFLRILTSSILKVYDFELVANHMSSIPFFQFRSAPRPFSRCQVIRFRTVKYFFRTFSTAELDCQSQHT